MTLESASRPDWVPDGERPGQQSGPSLWESQPHMRPRTEPPAHNVQPCMWPPAPHIALPPALSPAHRPAHGPQPLTQPCPELSALTPALQTVLPPALSPAPSPVPSPTHSPAPLSPTHSPARSSQPCSQTCPQPSALHTGLHVAPSPSNSPAPSPAPSPLHMAFNPAYSYQPCTWPQAQHAASCPSARAANFLTAQNRTKKGTPGPFPEVLPRPRPFSDTLPSSLHPPSLCCSLSTTLNGAGDWGAGRYGLWVWALGGARNEGFRVQERAPGLGKRLGCGGGG
ncbi:unnamed protein product [Eretmochelys imbricata]